VCALPRSSVLIIRVGVNIVKAVTKDLSYMVNIVPITPRQETDNQKDIVLRWDWSMHLNYIDTNSRLDCKSNLEGPM
jgi:hypothetical protein